MGCVGGRRRKEGRNINLISTVESSSEGVGSLSALALGRGGRKRGVRDIGDSEPERAPVPRPEVDLRLVTTVVRFSRVAVPGESHCRLQKPATGTVLEAESLDGVA